MKVLTKITLLAFIAFGMANQAFAEEIKSPNDSTEACINLCIEIETKICQDLKCPKTPEEIEDACRKKESCYTNH